jgi:hypothetical protein
MAPTTIYVDGADDPTVTAAVVSRKARPAEDLMTDPDAAAYPDQPVCNHVSPALIGDQAANLTAIAMIEATLDHAQDTAARVAAYSTLMGDMNLNELLGSLMFLALHSAHYFGEVETHHFLGEERARALQD